ncbi:MAG: SIS domain-containing protein [Gemmatimonadales bacterium]|nr:SIS domain-containing protein [Gemmatimonadales bacterium]
MSLFEAGLRDLAALARLLSTQADRIERLARRYADTLRRGGTIFFAGNGGSAADAQHVATEYVVRFKQDRRALRAVALTTDTSLLTAAGNDLGFERVFARQVEALARPGDLLVLHSTSGRSANLLAAAVAAREIGAQTVALLGRDGGSLATAVDEALIVPSEETSRIQELHLAIEHLIVEWVEQELIG